MTYFILFYFPITTAKVQAELCFRYANFETEFQRTNDRLCAIERQRHEENPFRLKNAIITEHVY